MKRREFIDLLGGVAATSIIFPLGVSAQLAARRIGVLMGAFTPTNPEGQAALAAFLDTLQSFGWTAGQTAQFDVRWMGDDVERGKGYAAELIALAPDVIFCSSSLAAVLVSRSTDTIPIVFAQVVDPVGNGWVKSLARPAGHMTGFSNIELETGGKWLEILKEIAPQVSKVAVLLYPQVPGYVNWLRQVEAAGPALSVEVTATRVHNANEIEHAITNFASQGGGGLVVLPSPITNGNYGLIAELAARYRLPAVYPYRFYVSSGAGLASYGADTIDWYRQAGSYVARILSGEKPADLPVQAPTKFQLVINLKTAKALGLTIPQSLLVRADEVIE